jgi:exosortase
LAPLLTIAFALPLYQLVRLALKTEIQSHILLIPFIAIYLWRTVRSPLRLDSPRPSDGRGIKGEGTGGAEGQAGEVSISSSATSHSTSPLRLERGEGQGEVSISKLGISAFQRFRGSLLPASLAALIALAALAAYWTLGTTARIAHNDALSLSTFSYLAFLLAAALATVGWQTLRPHLFALCFLVFMIPLPRALIDFLSIMLQHASADAGEVMLSLTGMPVFRDGQVFQFPGLSIRVAEECSGVRSTFVLFITSLLAGHLFLRSGWKKALLALAIFPLGILRNGFRITAISWLSVNVNPGIIDGPLHHHGGPLFFLLSLVPLFGLLWILRRSDLRRIEPLSASILSPLSGRGIKGEGDVPGL